MLEIIPTEVTASGLQTLLPTLSAEDNSPSTSRGQIITGIGVGGLVVLYIVTAVIVISVLMYLRKKKKDHYINNTHGALYQSISITKGEKS